MAALTTPHVDTAVGDDGIATLTLRSRTMLPDLFGELDAHLDALEANPALRVLIVRGPTDRVFSFGLDLPQAFVRWGDRMGGTPSSEQRHGLRSLIKQLQRPFNRLFRLQVPTICAIHGACIGGGLDIASACDIRLASREAVISLRETKIAIVADLGSLQRLPHIIGQGRTRELAFTGRDVTADEALAMGLVNAVYDTPDALFAAARAMALQIAQNSRRTVEGAKVALNRPIEGEIAEGLDHVAIWNSAFLASPDLSEAMAAFLDRRPPRFDGAPG